MKTPLRNYYYFNAPEQLLEDHFRYKKKFILLKKYTTKKYAKTNADCYSTAIFFPFVFSQTILQIAFIPVRDSNNNTVCYIKKSDINHKEAGVKIYLFNERTDTIGYSYSVGTKKRRICEPVT